VRSLEREDWLQAMPTLPHVAIVGAPNVGKSTLFNRLVGRRLALVTDEPGVTRDRIYGTAARADRPFRIVDTGGLRFDGVPFGKEILLQAEAALAESSLVLFLVDGRGGLTALDRDIAAVLRKSGAAVLVVVNKIDEARHDVLALEAHGLGLGDPVPISAEHGRGIDALLDAVDRRLEAVGAFAAPPHDGASPGAVRIALVGRPNVGKSSILNRLVGEERMVVSTVPGTTRDAVDTVLERGGRRYVLVDTAGLRRPGRVRETVESLSVMRARKAIDAADVVVLVLDGSTPLAAQDTHIAGEAADAARPIVVAVNKWDLVPEREARAKAWEADLRARLKFVKEVPIVFVSARTGQRVDRILERVDRVYADASRRVATPELNEWLQEEARRDLRAPAKGGSIRLFYGTQTGVRPPRFLLFCNDARRIHFSLRRHLENSLRARFGFGAAPLRLSFRSRRERAAR
jgi:GTP-binding protein